MDYMGLTSLVWLRNVIINLENIIHCLKTKEPLRHATITVNSKKISRTKMSTFRMIQSSVSGQDMRWANPES